jgi:hypothetical protein
VALIQDLEGNVFGGFTPVKWESELKFKADPSLKSFVSAEESAQFPGKDICAEGRKEGRSNRL